MSTVQSDAPATLMNSSIPTHGLGWFSLFARITRLLIFNYGVLPTSTWYERFLLNRFQNNLNGYGCCSCLGNYDITRAQKLVNVLLDLGGEECKLTPQDGEATLQVIKLTAARLKEKIESLRGRWEIIDDQLIIIPPDTETQEWVTFRDTLKKVFKSKRMGNGREVLVTSNNADLIPDIGEKKTQCILLARRGRSFVMNKFEIGYFLGKGIDVCVYDTRGVLNSTGYPTEGGIYNDIDVVGDFLMQSYAPSTVCIYGSCGDSFSAMHLFKRYQQRGINMILENSPPSLERVISRTVHFAPTWTFNFACRYAKAPSSSQCSGNHEDGFDSLKKISSLSDAPKGSYGYVLLAATVGDPAVTESDVNEMVDLLRQKGNTVHLLQSHPKDSLIREWHNDPHLSSPLRNPFLQERYVEVLFQTSILLQKNDQKAGFRCASENVEIQR